MFQAFALLAGVAVVSIVTWELFVFLFHVPWFIFWLLTLVFLAGVVVGRGRRPF